MPDDAINRYVKDEMSAIVALTHDENRRYGTGGKRSKRRFFVVPWVQKNL